MSSSASTAAGRRRASGRARRPKPKRASNRATSKRATAPRPRGRGAKANSKATRARSPKRTARTPTPKRTRRPASKRSARGSRRPRRALSRPSWPRRLALLAIVLAGVAGGYLLYLRDSSLVAVDDVEVVGVRGGERERIVGALQRAASEMTTLHVDSQRLERAVAGFPTVESISADPNFPHGLRIEVVERPPAMLLRAGGSEVPVAADGTVLAGVPVADEAALPVVEVAEPPAGDRLTGAPLEQALAAGAAPEALRPLIEGVDHSRGIGVELTLRGGIPVRFGNGSRAGAKWAAIAAVLSDPKLDALTYLDVRAPERPAVGGASLAIEAPTL